MDSDVEAARPWIESANPTYVTLIDRNHILSSLYNMVNVPQAVWIDENGIVVRPTETAGAIDILRDFDPSIGGFPPEVLENAGEAKNTYVGAVKDWAINGSASRYVFDPAAARAHVPSMTGEMALAHANFQLGQHLRREGRAEEAETLFARCRELHPASWNIFRQTTEKEETGIAVGDAFWGKVMALGDEQYYAGVDMDGMPD